MSLFWSVPNRSISDQGIFFLSAQQKSTCRMTRAHAQACMSICRIMYFIAGLKHLCSLKVKEDFPETWARWAGGNSRSSRKMWSRRCRVKQLIARIWGQKSPVVLKPIEEKIGIMMMVVSRYDDRWDGSCQNSNTKRWWWMQMQGALRTRIHEQMCGF